MIFLLSACFSTFVLCFIFWCCFIWVNNWFRWPFHSFACLLAKLPWPGDNEVTCWEHQISHDSSGGKRVCSNHQSAIMWRGGGGGELAKSSLNFYIACLHDQNKSGFFGGPAFIQPIRTICKVFKKLWLVGKKPLLFWSFIQAISGWKSLIHSPSSVYGICGGGS